MRAWGIAILLAWSLSAHASAPEVFGLGSTEAALAGASSARVHDFSAAYYNPAGLTRLRKPEVSAGLLGFGSALPVAHDRTDHVTDPLGVVVGAATPLPLGGFLQDRLFVGIALYALPDTIARVIARRPDETFWPRYDNRTQRLVVLPSIALALPRGLSIGLAFNYLAGLDGRIASAEGATRAIEARVDEQIFSHLTVNAGVRWQITPPLALALVYRQEFGVPFRTLSRNTVAGAPIDLDVDALGLYTPHELVLGGAFALRRVTLSLDLEWAHWSGWRGPYVTVTSQLPFVGAIDAHPPALIIDDTAAVRAGAEWTALDRPEVRLMVRGGYAFQSRALPEQAAPVRDGMQHRLTAGVGLRVPYLFHSHLRIDTHGSLELVDGQALARLWALGVTGTLEWP